MLLCAIDGVTPHRDDRKLIKRLAVVKVAPEGQTTRLGLLNEDRLVYRIIVCGIGRELDLVIKVLEALGFEETQSDGLLFVTRYFHKP